jgi:glycosyltransferase involved in cell wall biosynthesis
MAATVTLFFAAIRDRAAIYHIHDPELLPVAVVLSLFTRGRTIYDVHEHYPFSMLAKHWIPGWLRHPIALLTGLAEKLLSPFLDAVIYVTEPVGDRFRRKTGRKPVAVCVRNYPPLDVAKGIRVPRSKDPAVAYMGNVSGPRDMETTVRAIPRVLARFPRARFVLMGPFVPAGYGERLRRLARELGVEHALELPGLVPYREGLARLARSSVGILPLADLPAFRVAMANKLFEYMALSLPVVAADLPENRKVVEKARCGLLARPGDARDLAEKINRILGDPRGAAAMGRRGLAAFRKRYNWTSEERALLRLYANLLRR